MRKTKAKWIQMRARAQTSSSWELTSPTCSLHLFFSVLNSNFLSACCPLHSSVEMEWSVSRINVTGALANYDSVHFFHWTPVVWNRSPKWHHIECWCSGEKKQKWILSFPRHANCVKYIEKTATQHNKCFLQQFRFPFAWARRLASNPDNWMSQFFRLFASNPWLYFKCWYSVFIYEIKLKYIFPNRASHFAARRVILIIEFGQIFWLINFRSFILLFV